MKCRKVFRILWRYGVFWNESRIFLGERGCEGCIVVLLGGCSKGVGIRI